jgi:hypothetical protein
MVAAVIPRPPWCLPPDAAAFGNQPTYCWVTVLCGGTMPTIVGHLGHDVSADVVGFL